MLLAVAAISFASCSNKAENEGHNHEVNDDTGEALPVEEGDTTAAAADTSSVAHVHYMCPMDCEKGKMYDENVGCPVCKMDLEEVAHEAH